MEWVRQARQALAAKDSQRAEYLARQAEQLHVPESAFAPGEDRPAFLLMDLAAGAAAGGGQSREYRAGYGGAGVVVAAGGALGPDNGVARAYYDPLRDATRNIPAAASSRPAPSSDIPSRRPSRSPRRWGGPSRPASRPAPPPATRCSSRARRPCRRTTATGPTQLFRQAAAYMNELDPVTAQRLQDHLQLLVAPRQAGGAPAGPPGSAVDEAAAQQQALQKQVSTDLAHAEGSARAMKERIPKAALAMLEDLRRNIATSSLEPAARDQMLKRLDRSAGRAAAVHRAEPPADRAGREERADPPGPRTARRGPRRKRRRSSPSWWTNTTS